MTDDKLRNIFKHFDVDDTGYISKENLKAAMVAMGEQMTDEEIDKAINRHDIAHDGRISFDEFKVMFQ